MKLIVTPYPKTQELQRRKSSLSLPSTSWQQRQLLPQGFLPDQATFSAKAATQKNNPGHRIGFLKMLALATTLVSGAPTSNANPLFSASVAHLQPTEPIETVSSLNRIEQAMLAEWLQPIQTKAIQFFQDTWNPVTGFSLDRFPNHVVDKNKDVKKEYPLESTSATGYWMISTILACENKQIFDDPNAKPYIQQGMTGQEAAQKMVMHTLNRVEKLCHEHPEWEGFLPHFWDTETGKPWPGVENSTVDTAIFYLGAIAAGEYYGGEVKQKVETMFQKINFNKCLNADKTAITHGFYTGPDGITKPIPYHWGGPYSEGVTLLTLLSLGSKQLSPEVKAKLWDGWSREMTWSFGGRKSFASRPLFIYYFNQGFYDLKKLKERPGKTPEQFWEASYNAILMQKDYCKRRGYPENTFGISATGQIDNPGGYVAYEPMPESRLDTPCENTPPENPFMQFHEPTDSYDDGTLSPPSILACLAIAERESFDAFKSLRSLFPDMANHKYGLANAVNVHTKHQLGDAYGIDLGSMLTNINGYENGLIHHLMAKSPIIQDAISSAGFLPLELPQLARGNGN